MLFVTFATARGTFSKRETLARRLEYHYPEGVNILSEYWPMTGDPAVVLIAEADDIRPVMKAVGDWIDAYDIKVFPAVTAEEGIALFKEELATAMSLTPEHPVELATR